jgi:cystathionine beta-synthase
MKYYKNILETIGNTPLVKLNKITSSIDALVLAKVETTNPGNSVKDRMALQMIEDAEADGRLKPGGTVVEGTSGNTGMGLALACIVKGYKLVCTVSDKQSKEKVDILRAMGAEVIVCPTNVEPEDPRSYYSVARRVAEETPNSICVNQYDNPSNTKGHYLSTGPEIWEQMQHQVDAVVCGVGSGGTITGLGKYFASVSPETEMVLADPVGSILCHYIETGEMLEAGSWYIEGIGEDFIPSLCDLSYVRAGYSISDRESFETARKLLKDEGILAGSSSGTLVSAAVKYCQQQASPKRVLTFICDSGNKYLSKMFNDFWMRDHGFIQYQKHDNLRDYVTRRFSHGAVVTVGPHDTLLNAYKRMKLYDISQLPVMADNAIVGMLDESDLLYAVLEDKTKFASPVESVMATRLRTFHPNDDIKDVIELLRQGFVAIIAEDNVFHGLITRMDLLNQLRLELEA